jgi:flagellar basal body rod protein FlgG
MYSIKKMNIQVVGLSGATVLRKDIPYQSGTIDMSNLPAGTYIVTITSNDRKYQSTKKIIKN